MKNGIIGIVGGMGPDAGIALSGKIISHTIAGKDQDHLPQILYSVPENITDRTEYITGKIKTNPADGIIRILSDMESIGVIIAALACNSAHAPQIFDVIVYDLQNRKSKIRLLHMIEEVGNFITFNYPYRKKVGILGTTGTYLTRQYDLLNKFGLETVNISQDEQKYLHQAIYNPDFGVKSNAGIIHERAVEIMKNAAASLVKSGAELIVLGCTDLPVIYKERYFQDLPVIDSSAVLARALINAHSPGKLKPWSG